MKNTNLTAKSWADYELLDSGDNKKLERFGQYTLIRPETQALWKPSRPEIWKKADAEFRQEGERGVWQKKGMPDEWQITWEKIFMNLRLTSFKHTGVFPEQAANWEWIQERTGNLKHPRVLNLFGYTGVASLVAAQHGAQVTHVDASKQSNAWAKENARLSVIPETSVRYMLDDTLKFTEREVRREAVYEGIILDPPAFGRGAKGETWHIEKDLPKLLKGIAELLSPKTGSFFLLNGYAAGYSPESFRQVVEDSFPEIRSGFDGPDKLTANEYGELHISESHSERIISAGIYVRFVR